MKKILAFEVGGRDFGICTDRLREVVPHRAVTSVPGVPDFLLGVISLRHEVIPIVDLRALFDGQPTDMDATTCLVIAMHRSHDGNLTPVGLVARKVQNTHRIDERDLEDPPAIGGHRQTQSVHGLARTDDGLKIVLDIDRMFGEHRDALQAALDQDCSRQAGSPDATLSHGKSGENHPTARPKASNNRRIKLLSVWVANVEYAFPLSEIHKTAPCQETEQDPLAPSVLCGATTLGRHRLGLVDLAEHLGLNAAERVDGRDRTIVIAEHDAVPVGYLIDRVGALREVDESELLHSESFENLAASHGQTIGFIEVEDRALEVLSFARLLTDIDVAAIRNWKGTEERILEATGNQRQPRDEDDPSNHPLRHLEGTYILVQVGSHQVGINAADTDEVVPLVELLQVPHAEADFAGILDLRDRTYPVMDLCRHFGFEPTVEAGWHPVVVLVRSGENRVGLVVQNVVQLARVTTRELLPKQESSVEVHDRLIAGAANLNGRTIPLLDMPAILSDHEPSRLAKWESFKQQARLDGIDAEAVVCHG